MSDDNIENIKTELKQLKDQGLILDYKLNQMKLDRVEFEIITIEGINLEIETSTNYCYKVINHNDEFLYESFEQFMNKYSKDYTRKFQELINNKLFELINKNQEEQNEEDR